MNKLIITFLLIPCLLGFATRNILDSDYIHTNKHLFSSRVDVLFKFSHETLQKIKNVYKKHVGKLNEFIDEINGEVYDHVLKYGDVNQNDLNYLSINIYDILPKMENFAFETPSLWYVFYRDNQKYIIYESGRSGIYSDKFKNVTGYL